MLIGPLSGIVWWMGVGGLCCCGRYKWCGGTEMPIISGTTDPVGLGLMHSRWMLITTNHPTAHTIPKLSQTIFLLVLVNDDSNYTF